MKPVLWLPAFSALSFILIGCADTNSSVAGDPLGTGPFDSRGNYREEWADDPSKWRKPGSRSQPAAVDEVPAIARNEQPPPSANPLATTPVSPTRPAPSQVSVPKPSAGPQVVAERPKPVVAKPKPKPVVKAKPKPKTTRHLVKKGDTLSAIAGRYGSSVSAIRSANGISGSLIRPGQSLVIPKR